MTKGGGKTASLQSYKQKVAKKLASSEDDSQPQHEKRWYFAVVVLAIFFSAMNSFHLNTLFENDRHFSHLADFEREMAYRTEMGLYYSYYKTLITAPSFATGLYEITHDDVTEYGHTINTLKRFNLYPEVVLGFAYRQFRWISGILGWRTEVCWQVNRGEGLEPVQSCEGVGNPHYFYIYSVFALAGTVAGSLFILGTILSDSIFGGLLSSLFFFFNHGESTRVQWTPPLRESFSYPIIIAQITLVTYMLKYRCVGWHWVLSFSALSVSAMLSWQFAQFAFFTQICSLFAVFAFDFSPLSTIKTIIMGHMISFAISFIFLFGNEMLLTSLYFPSILGMMIVLFLDRPLQILSLRPLHVLVSLILFLGSTLFLKITIANVLKVEDDAHIFEILKSKFTDFASFHTRLYTCAAEFDFMQPETLYYLCKTLLLPCGILSIVLFVGSMLLNQSILWREQTAREHRQAEVFYVILQLICFATMAILIMRLKLFFTPQLAAVSAIIIGGKFLSSLRLSFSNNSRVGFAIALIAVAAFQGTSNLNKQLSIRGEYSNPDQEMLFEWINKSTKKTAVFGGTMPVMANVKLSTERPIVNHPHYEDAGIRERTLKVYSMFSKKPLTEVHSTLKAMGIQYFVFQMMNCAPHPTRPECSYRSMWDLHDPSNTGRPSLCDLFEKVVSGRGGSVNPFKMVYNKAGYTVFQL